MADRVLPAIILALAGFYLVQAAQLPFGAAARPGPGFYPTVVGVFACVVALVALVQAWRAPRVARAKAVVDPDAPAQRRRVLITVVALAGFCLLMPWVGYPLAACAFGIVGLRGLGSRWISAIAFGVLTAVGSHVLFAVLLDVPLPRGVW
jgi:putative tricarboxylic transport membrane protein